MTYDKFVCFNASIICKPFDIDEDFIAAYIFYCCFVFHKYTVKTS